MKKILELTKKYTTQILVLLLIIFFFRSCNNSTKIRKLEKIKTENNKTIDSLVYTNDSISKLIPTHSNIHLMKLKVQYETYDKILNEMTKLQVTCGTFRETHILKPKVEISGEIKKLEH